MGRLVHPSYFGALQVLALCQAGELLLQVYNGLKNVTTPVFIIAGDLDMILPVQYDIEAASIIPGCSLIQWPDAGHASLAQHCLSSGAIVSAWLDDDA